MRSEKNENVKQRGKRCVLISVHLQVDHLILFINKDLKNPTQKVCETETQNDYTLALSFIFFLYAFIVLHLFFFNKTPFSSSSKNVIKTPFVGLSVAPPQKLWLPTTTNLGFDNGSNPRRSFEVFSTKEIARVPLDQRWMFEDDEVDGPNCRPRKQNSERKKFERYDIWNNTWYPKAADHVNTEKPWYIVDATDKILGRMASTIAIYIRGKNLATYTPSVDMGAFVIVVNAEKVAVSGKKRTQKLYRRHSGRPGGMTVETFDQLQQRIPERIIEHAVRGMLPKGRLGRALFNHLKVYKGPDHPHEAQKPVELPIKDKRIQIQK
ncbi:Ribosomal protein L13 family protein [Prunus dulcis]|uniref:Large ribosomal subunit protein uL13c n=1 Tax=Prunus dulcis TaxID=3755 RepID=A0A4Y1RBM7_PRUDU|nr:Ribosomal protein L13 family protein [Prunus dulcis]